MMKKGRQRRVSDAAGRRRTGRHRRPRAASGFLADLDELVALAGGALLLSVLGLMLVILGISLC